MGVTFAYAADIVKSERNADGDLVVYGKATGPDLDLDGQICDPKWLQKAMPDWMTFGNVREMHQPIAAGVGTELTQNGNDWNLRSVCVDPTTALKIEKKVLTGYSVGIRDPKVVKDAGAPGGRIVGGTIIEVSYVDRPCNPTAKMAIAKAAKVGGALEAVEAVADLDKTVGTDGAPGETPVGDPAKGDDASVSGAEDVTAADPREGGQEDAAESADKSLARGVGRTILAGLKALKLAGGQPLLTKAAPDQDIASAEACMSAIGALIGQEAQGLVDGMQCEAYQIECLLRAYNALQYFCALEASEPAEEVGDVEVIVLDAKPQITKNNPKPTTETAETVTTKTDDGAEVAELKGRVKTLEARLAKVLEQPVPGGPVLTRRVEDIQKADGRTELLTKAAHFELLARNMQVTDPAAAKGYRELAAAARAEA